MPGITGEHVQQRRYSARQLAVFWPVMCLAGCEGATDSPPAQRSIAVIASCDTHGWIVPCGCSSNQAGGLLRRASYVEQVRRERDVLLVDVGGAAAGTTPYDLANFEAILQGEAALRTAAHNLGAAEAALDATQLRRLAEELHAPFVSANVTSSTGEQIAPSHRIVPIGGVKFAVFGVLSPSLAPAGVKVSDPRQAILSILPQLNGGYNHVLVLAYLPEQELEALATSLPEADLIVGGPTGQSIAPRRAGPVVWGSVTNKGKYLLHLNRSVKANTWDGQPVELGHELPDDPQQKKNLDKFRHRLAKLDFSADQTGFRPPLPSSAPPDFRVAGTDACRDCHSADCESWTASRHAHAWQTLVDQESHVDPACQRCHTTAYGYPDGFQSVASSAARLNVGCESCHGPAQAHVQDSAARTLFRASDRCIECHDRENSPEFKFDPYWKKIIHGQSATPESA